MNGSIKSPFIKNVLRKIEASLLSGEFLALEDANIELKDLSGDGKWTAFYKTVCGFLNTNGGVVFCGVRENEFKKTNKKEYVATGFDRNNEPKIVRLRDAIFKNDNGIFLDLSDYIFSDYATINTKNGHKEILVLVINPLSDDLKYLTYEGDAYERVLTGEHKITAAKWRKQQEYKTELEYSKEISTLSEVRLDDLSLDKINRYIYLLNYEIKKESPKASFEQAKSFLTRQYFIKGEAVTLLGMLVCGEDPFHFLGMRAEVNCYYDTLSDIGRDKKILRNDVIELMDDAFRYIWGHININRTAREGGKRVPEYPETLIRETINNALAHRDYTINDFITVCIEPNRYIEIKNPGDFKEKIKVLHTSTEIPIRWLISGVPESKNPKLASVLKVFDKIESRGRGMASLVNAALDNEIDMPYYHLKNGTITLRIPTGKLVDEFVENWLKGFANYIVQRLKTALSPEHKAILAYFYKSERLNEQRNYTIALNESNNHFEVIAALRKAKLLLEHEASTEDTPIYVLDRVLMKTDFTDELFAILGQEFITYAREAKEILNLVYLFSKYNQQALKASDISPEVYRLIHGNEIIGRTYDTLSRKVRKVCNQFEQKGIFKKDDKNAYTFVFDFQEKTNRLL